MQAPEQSNSYLVSLNAFSIRLERPTEQTKYLTKDLVPNHRTSAQLQLPAILRLQPVTSCPPSPSPSLPFHNPFRTQSSHQSQPTKGNPPRETDTCRFRTRQQPSGIVSPATSKPLFSTTGYILRVQTWEMWRTRTWHLSIQYWYHQPSLHR